MSASSVLGIIGASLALADALLNPSTNTTTKTTQKEKTKSSYTQTASKNDKSSTKSYQTTSKQTTTTQYNSNNNQNYNSTQYQNQSGYNQNYNSNSQDYNYNYSPPNQPAFKTTNSGQSYQDNSTGYVNQQQTQTKYEPVTQVQQPVAPPPKKEEPSEEEKFLVGFLPTLYSGDREAIKKNTDGCDNDDDLSDLIIEDLMKFSEKAEAHQGFASAKVSSRRTSGDHIALSTTVTFKDETTSEEVFNVIKDKNGNLKYYVE